MTLGNKRRGLRGLVRGMGVAAGIAGFVGGFCSAGTTLVLVFSIWVVAARRWSTC